MSVLALSLCLGLQQRQAAVRGTVVVSPRSSEPRWTPDQGSLYINSLVSGGEKVRWRTFLFVT